MSYPNVFIIAEVGQAHNGEIEVVHDYIDASAKTGIDAIKFQTHIAEAESSVYEPFRVKMHGGDKTRYDYWKRMEFVQEEWLEIKNHCLQVGLEFMSSPFSNAAVDLLEKIGIDKYKIASGEVTNLLILEKIAKTNKEIILSSGMSSFKELDKTVNFLKSFGNKLSILQCTTKYPTQPEDIGLNILGELKERYDIPVGLSDHSGTIFPSLAAATLGARIIEVHITLDQTKNSDNPDASASLTIEELSQMVEGVRFIEKAMHKRGVKDINNKVLELKNIFEKSLAINKDLKEGHILTFDDLEGKKPANKGMSAGNFKKVIGTKLKISKKKYAFLNEEDLVLG